VFGDDYTIGPFGLLGCYWSSCGLNALGWRWLFNSGFIQGVWDSYSELFDKILYANEFSCGVYYNSDGVVLCKVYF